MKQYVAKEVVCPFYAKESPVCLYCEGVGDGDGTLLHFQDKSQKQQHKNRYCNTFLGYPTCPLYGAINRKYEEDGNA